MRYVFIDAETYYDQAYSLKKMTPPEYILDPRFEMLGMSVAESFECAPYWIDAEDVPRFFKDQQIKYKVTSDVTLFCSHNWLFDGAVFAYKYGFVPPAMACTMAITRAVAKHKLGILPSLAKTAKFLGLPEKMGTIQRMMGVHLHQLRANTALYNEFKEYTNHDTWLCREIFMTWCIRTRKFPASEMPILDNVLRTAVRPKFVLDIPVLEEHLQAVRASKEKLLVEAGVSDKAELMSAERFAELLRKAGVEPPMKPSPANPEKLTYAFSKQDLGFLKLEEHEDPMVQALFAARVGNKTTLEETRTQRMIAIGNLHWNGQPHQMPMPLRYSAAKTHRLGGDWQLNVQNLPRKSPMRKALKAPEGFVVVAGDASQIEARLVATCSGAWTLVDQFASGEDVYATFASLVFGFPVDKDGFPTERFVGKQGVLGLGYGLGWLNFMRRIQIDSKNQTGKMIFLDENQSKHVVNTYRQTYHEVPDSWNLLGTTGLDVLVNGGAWQWGPVLFEKGMVTGPNGLVLRFPDLKWDGKEWTYNSGYEGRKKLYGGKIMENVIQFLSRIITMEAGVRIRMRVGPFALQSHDELAYIVSENKVEEVGAIMLEEMRVRPDWLSRAPLTAEIKSGPNYLEMKRLM